MHLRGDANNCLIRVFALKYYLIVSDFSGFFSVEGVFHPIIRLRACAVYVSSFLT